MNKRFELESGEEVPLGTALLRKGREQGREQGREEGRGEGREEGQIDMLREFASRIGVTAPEFARLQASRTVTELRDYVLGLFEGSKLPN